MSKPKPKKKNKRLTPEERKARAKLCGMKMTVADAKTGGFKEKVFLCGVWQECEWCYNIRKQQIEEQVKDAIAQCKHPVTLKLTPDEAKALRERLKEQGLEKEDYSLFPTFKYDMLVLDADKWDVSEFDTSPIDDIDMDDLAFTPGGRRPSGALGHKPATPSIEEPENKSNPAITVRVPEVVAKSGEGHTLMDARIEAIESSLHFEPELNLETLEDDIGYLEWCLMKRWIDDYSRAIEAQGGEVLHVGMGRQTFQFSSYSDWSQIRTKLDEWKEVQQKAQETAKKVLAGTVSER